MFELHHGDSLDVLRGMADNSVDAIVTDPPYGLSFMGKRWDYDVPSEELWRECLRVLKPGGHLLAFAGTRTQHRMAVRIEDAGFEIRDMIAWVYGSGFPKSLDVSKTIDKRGGNVAGFAEFRDAVKAAMEHNGVTRKQLQAALGNHMLSHYLTAGSQPAVPVLRDYRIIRETVGLGRQFDELFNDEAEREVVGRSAHKSGIANATEGHHTVGGTVAEHFNITAPATPAAREWHGWGTALKPSLEPITVARKPLIGTVAENVLAWGTGGVNVDGCRVAGEYNDTDQYEYTGKNGVAMGAASIRLRKSGGGAVSKLGRWPANLIHDGSDEVVGLFPETGPSKKANRGVALSGPGTHEGWKRPSHSTYAPGMRGHNDNGGSAARFFYCAKASKADRGEGNAHPTVKPTDLMRYLCRLVTPPGGTVLDPFMGSGSTGKAAVLEGFRFIGIEREAEYIDIARARIDHVTKEPNLWQS